jgi:hypothetical protein
MVSKGRTDQPAPGAHVLDGLSTTLTALARAKAFRCMHQDILESHLHQNPGFLSVTSDQDAIGFGG